MSTNDEEVFVVEELEAPSSPEISDAVTHFNLIPEPIKDMEEEAHLLSSRPTYKRLEQFFRHRHAKVVLAVAVIVSIVLIICISLGLLIWMSNQDKHLLPLHPPSKVLIISLDGFRWDYLQRNLSLAPNLAKLAATGLSAEYLNPCFPSKTFPNHYSIVTGLYPESHGIISNTIWDPTIDYIFTLSNQGPTDARWWLGEPIWVTAMKAGLKTATYFWPGSEAPIEGMYPTYYAPFKQSEPPLARADGLLAWLDKDPHIRFMAVYFDTVDSAGHEYGPDSGPQLNAAIEAVDAGLGRLLEGLHERDMAQHTDVIVVSDHGMTAISPEHVIYLDECLNMSSINVIDWTPITALFPNNMADLQQIYQNASQCHPNMTAYLKDEIPARFHYQASPRITPIIFVADLGYTITTHARAPVVAGGNHGFDNQLMDMQSTFIASGPHFKVGGQIFSPFPNIEIYNLMASILGLTNGAPNNGTDLLTRELLVNSTSKQ